MGCKEDGIIQTSQLNHSKILDESRELNRTQNFDKLNESEYFNVESPNRSMIAGNPIAEESEEN